MLFLGILQPVCAGMQVASEIVDIPFEQLLQTEVITAERLSRQISAAPSAVSVVTAQDIRTFGYRTLGDILSSMRGLNVSHDEDYGFLTGRGFANPNDYAGRISLLIDGYLAPDNLWGQIYFEHDGLIDVELIERVEYIPGSGSTSYGDSAFLGVINVVTKKGGDIGGVSVSAESGSHGWRRKRVSYGQRFENGLDFLLSVSALETSGRTLSSENREDFNPLFERQGNRRLFMKSSYRGWSLETGWLVRALKSPYDTVFDAEDRNGFLSLKHSADLGSSVRQTTHVYHGHYRYSLSSESSGGDWWGVDNKLVINLAQRDTLVLGMEYRDDYQQIQEIDGLRVFEMDRQTVSLYGYYDFSLADDLQATFGARVDSRGDHAATVSPRLALIYSPRPGSVFKGSVGMANRQPTAAAESAFANTAPERLRSAELVWEQSLGVSTRMIAAVYHYDLNNYNIGWWTDEETFESFENHRPLSAKGAELELEHLWDNGTRLKVSFAHQDTRTADSQTIINLPKNVIKLNLGSPVYGDNLRVGLGVRYVGRYLGWMETYDPGSLVADLTLSGEYGKWFGSLSVRNMANARYAELGYLAYYDGGTGRYGADGRNVWLQIGYTFK